MRQTFQNRRILAALVCVLSACGVNAQKIGAQEIFSPFVSQLNAEVSNNSVRLSWIDSLDARGPVFIFRSSRQIDRASLSGLRPMAIPYGTQYFVDEIGGESAYYFVAASGIDGYRYDIIIPFTNTVATGAVRSPWADTPAPAAVWQGQYSQPVQKPEISSLNAYADGDRVIISYSTNGYAKPVVLYRNTQPMRQIQDLLNAVVVQSSNSSPIIDYPAPGYSYYYALFFADDVSRGTIDIQPGRNETINPVIIAARAYAPPPEIRAMPLPQMPAQIPSPPRIEQPRFPAAASRPPVPVRRPRVFARDLETPTGTSAVGEESILRSIVQGPISRRDWGNARNQLLQYLSQPRSPASETRARFYLGQAYYFTGQNREALNEFLFVQDAFPREAAGWIEAIMATLGG